MLYRIAEFSSVSSFFLFGARGTGKTWLLMDRYNPEEAIYIDLLNPDIERRYLLDPNELLKELAAVDARKEWIIIDEIQKVPKLLDLVHQQIETAGQKFILSGSSARKLKRGAANLLAGRAFVYHLYPLAARELGKLFSLEDALNWGTLPRLLELHNPSDKYEYLRAYTNTYIREEILQEQIVRKLEPFQRFLQVAAQMSGRVINYSKIAKEAGTSVPTVQSYFQILEDTLLGFTIPAFHESIRKRQRESPKFYFIDGGIQRALNDELLIPLKPKTYSYGFAFEQFVINEIYRLQSYYRKDYRLSYLRTGADVEVDLVIERPGEKRAVVEIKSATKINDADVRAIQSLGSGIRDSELYCFSLDPTVKKIGDVLCIPWQRGLEEIGL
ncbi:MAG TPA: AAA family ATPase [Saprospiraceae bacterium]|nr:AAA family ATPase [Saprospiraceae bacterium]